MRAGALELKSDLYASLFSTSLVVCPLLACLLHVTEEEEDEDLETLGSFLEGFDAAAILDFFSLGGSDESGGEAKIG